MHKKFPSQNLRKLIREIVEEEIAIPGDVPPENQVHLFDFDDTLAVTQDPTAVMLYNDGKPAHNSADEVMEWLASYGVSESDLIKPGISQIPQRGGYAAYIASAALARIQSSYDRSQQKVSGISEPKQGESILMDFTPCASTNLDAAKPIDSTIEKMKKMQSTGATTGVVTARKEKGSGIDLHGHKVDATNKDDIIKFLAQNGVSPSAGVVGVSGQNKGNFIAQAFANDENTKEIHFYDDMPKNTSEVEQALAKKIPSELFIYGPGEFDKGEADPNTPSKGYPAKKQKVESFDLSRWNKLAGLK